MKSVKTLCSALVLLVACLFATSAFAQADKSGLILDAGLTVPITINAGASASDDSDSVNIAAGDWTAVGVGLSLSVGYRWGGFGIRLNQDIDGQFVVTKDIVDLYDAFDKKANYFLGGTHLMFDEYIVCSPNFLITLSEGLGALYGAKMDFPAFMVKSDAAFSLKVAAQFEYFITPDIGVGLAFEYGLALAIDNGISLTHFIQPMLSFKYIL